MQVLDREVKKFAERSSAKQNDSMALLDERFCLPPRFMGFFIEGMTLPELSDKSRAFDFSLISIMPFLPLKIFHPYDLIFCFLFGVNLNKDCFCFVRELLNFRQIIAGKCVLRKSFRLESGG